MSPRRKSSDAPAPRSAEKKATGKPNAPLGFGLMNPATSEPQYTAEETEFIRAVEEYKRRQRRNFPTLRELLHVLRSLGYRKERVPRDFLTTEGLDAEQFPDPE